MDIKQSLQILELSSTYTEKELTITYRTLARKWHPDINKDPKATDKFKEIQQAYEILKNNKNYMCCPIPPYDFFSFPGNFFDMFSNKIWSRFIRESSRGLLMQLEFEDLSEEDSERIVQVLEKEGIKVKGYLTVTGSASYVRK